MNTAFA